MGRKNARHKRRCQQKAKHASRDNAEFALDQLCKSHIGVIRSRMNIYKCPFCGYYHIGRKSHTRM